MRRRSGFGWGEFLSGLCMIILGIFSICHPEGVATWITVIYGVIAIITGICDVIFYMKTERYTGFGPIVALISGILSVMTGTILVAHPTAGAWLISILFSVWFISHCISRLVHLSTIRFIAGTVYFYLSMAINICGLALGIMMIFRPAATFLTVALIVGIYLIISGVESIIIAISRMGSNW